MTLTEGQLERLANEMYTVACSMKPEDEWNGRLEKNDLFLVLLHQYGCKKQEYMATEYPNDDWPLMYEYEHKDALDLAYERLLVERRLVEPERYSSSFVVVKDDLKRRMRRATWPFHAAQPKEESNGTAETGN